MPHTLSNGSCEPYPAPQPVVCVFLCSQASTRREQQTHAVGTCCVPRRCSGVSFATLAPAERENGSPEDVAAADALCGTFWTNLALVQLKISAHKKVLESCDAALGINPANVKAHYFKAKVVWALCCCWPVQNTSSHPLMCRARRADPSVLRWHCSRTWSARSTSPHRNASKKQKNLNQTTPYVSFAFTTTQMVANHQRFQPRLTFASLAAPT